MTSRRRGRDAGNRSNMVSAFPPWGVSHRPLSRPALRDAAARLSSPGTPVTPVDLGFRRDAAGPAFTGDIRRLGDMLTAKQSDEARFLQKPRTSGEFDDRPSGQ